MDFIKNLFQRHTFNNLQSSSLHLNSSKITQDNPVEIIEQEIKNLININLSPLPQTKELIYIQQNDISSCLRKIIFYFDQIFNHKLKLNKEITHYWQIFSKELDSPHIKFINEYDKIPCQTEKGIAWILIIILENSFKDTIKEIYKLNLDKKYYQSDSYLISNKYEIMNISENLSKLIVLFKSNKLSIYRDFKKFKNSGKEENKGKSENQYMSPIKIIQGKENIDSNIIYNSTNNKYQTFSNFNASNFNASNFNASNLNASNLNPTPQSENQLKTLDNLLNIINKEKSFLVEENPYNIEDHHDNLKFINSHEEEKNLQEKFIPNKTIENISVECKHQFEYRNGKILQEEDQIRKTAIKDQWKLVKYLDFQNQYEKNFYFASNKKRFSWNSRKLTIEDAKEKLQHYPIEKRIKIIKKHQKNKFTDRDKIYINGEEARITNSLLFFMNYFYGKSEYFKFETKNDGNIKPMTLHDQNNQCHLCLKKFKLFLNIPLERISWCSYYNRFICNDCLSDEFSIIPAFVIKFWNFDKFSISKEAQTLLKREYDKPIIYIKNSDKLLKISSKFRRATIMKRTIHKIFDLMKCENHDIIANEILGYYNYLILKEVYFSLKDLNEIQEGSLLKKLKDFLQKFEDHLIKECKVCNFKGSKCMMCLSDEILMAYNIENVFYCPDCKKVFHRKCSQFHPCYINKLQL